MPLFRKESSRRRLATKNRSSGADLVDGTAAWGEHTGDFVVPDDVKALAVPVLSHRLILHPEAEFLIHPECGCSTQVMEYVAAGDVAIVHNNCVHQHFNASVTRPARALVIKTKPMYMFMNMLFQQTVEPRPTGRIARR